MYYPSDKMKRQVNEAFTYHPPSQSQALRYQQIRDQAKTLAGLLLKLCPESRELSSSLTLLQNATMMANAAIACNESREASLEPHPDAVKEE